jgi:glycosyltransferase involved in cell wall biosynthesis
MSLPFLSICIPAFQRPEHLSRLLTSIERQTFKNYEIILTDDSPGDEVFQIAEKYFHLPLQYFKNEQRAGSPGNWNRAIGRSNTGWIQLMHSDDWYASDGSLQKFAEAAQGSQSHFIFSASKEINTEKQKVKDMRLDRQKKKLLENPVNLLYENVIGHPSVVLHRKDPAIEYNTSFKWVVDIDFYIRYLQKHGDYHYINEPLVNIGVDESMISHVSYKNPDVEIPEYLNLLNQFPGSLPRTNPWAFYCLWKLVKKFRIKDGAYLKAHGYTGKKVEGMDFIINYQKKIPRIILKQTNPSNYFMKRCYQKFIKQPRHSSV